MRHEEALQAAQDAYFNRANPLLREDGINDAVRAYLEVYAETHLTQWPALGCPACNADNLLADFGDER